MNISAKSKKSLLFLGIILSASVVMAQDTAPVSVAPSQNSIHEQLGLSSTALFTIMTIFTVLLLAFTMSMASSTKNILKYKQDRLNTKNTPKIILALVGLFASVNSSAATQQADSSLIAFPDSVFWAYIAVDVVLIMIMIYFAGIVKASVSDYVVIQKRLRWKKFKNRFTKRLTKSIPIENEASILLDHDYDGIKELDNQLPPWWKYGFYVTIVWAVFYLFYYQILEIGPLQEAEYAQQLADADAEMAAYKALHPEMITVENVELLTDATALSLGRSIFNQNCVSCHMENGIGGVGPNLTDDYWLYENDIKGVFTTISEGASNGMRSWKSDLSADKIQAVASYILQLDYIAPPTGKEPQGVLK